MSGFDDEMPCFLHLMIVLSPFDSSAVPRVLCHELLETTRTTVEYTATRMCMNCEVGFL